MQATRLTDPIEQVGLFRCTLFSMRRRCGTSVLKSRSEVVLRTLTHPENVLVSSNE